MSAGLPINMGVFEGAEKVDEQRHLRLVAASLDDDLEQLRLVAEEVSTDPRGPDVAAWQLVVLGAVGLARQWVAESNKDLVLNGIRRVLIENVATS